MRTQLTTFITKTILVWQKFATCFGQYGHHQAKRLTKLTKEGRTVIERGLSLT
jgi:hypothetical protein